MHEIERALNILRRAGKGVIIQVVDVKKSEFSTSELLTRWNKGSTWLENNLLHPDCLLEVKFKGGKGRGRATKYYPDSVLKEEIRLKKLNKI